LGVRVLGDEVQGLKGSRDLMFKGSRVQRFQVPCFRVSGFRFVSVVISTMGHSTSTI
jgi:hypothetical protein